MRTTLFTPILICSIGGMALIGCAPIIAIQYSPAYIPNPVPNSYEDRDWVTVLQDNLRDGLVDYRHLSENREPLERYLGLISVAGPESTPNLFPTPSDQMCYYINAYNACVLRAVLELYPTSMIHGINKPRLDYEYIFRIDHAHVKLAQIREKLEAVSRGDARVLFCLSEASMGSPALSDQSYQPNPLREQMRHAAQKALQNPLLFRVDDQNRRVLLWNRIISNRDWCMAFYQRQAGSAGGNLLSFLTDLADPSARDRLLQTQGYRVARMPVDRRLNDLNPIAQSSAAGAHHQ